MINKFTWLFLFLITFVIVFIYLTKKPNIRISKAILNGYTINLEIADTSSLRNRGLSDREILPANSGMLFIFENYAIHNFWMNRMNFPLDFIWIKDDMIVDLDEDVPVKKDDNITIVEPSEPINRVLEINSGIIRKLGLKKGDKIIFQ